MTHADPVFRRETGAYAGGFESVLTAGALNTFRGRVPTVELTHIAYALARHPRPALGRVIQAAREIGLIAKGVDEKPGACDRRFSDVGWQDNALLQRIALGYLAGSSAVEDIVADAGVDWRTRERARVFVDNVLAAAAPSNNPLLHPASLKRAIDTAGASWIRGLRSLAADMSNRPRIPSAVDDSGYRLGENLAATPGKVIRRGRLYELIQYEPMSESVDTVPVLCVASPVNKYYLLDLGSQESVTRALLERGHQLFTVSWVNPDESHQDVGLDDYVAAIVEMIETVAEVSGSDHVHLVGFCGGGQLAFTTAGYLAATGRQNLLATLTIAIAVVDFERGGAVGAILDRRLADRSIAIATRRGYFDGRDTAEMFAWIRPNDGIWVHVVNNYLLGLPLTTFDLVYWSTDQTNLALVFGTQLVDITLGNAWAKPGGVQVLGTSLDPGEITVDTYILGASTDHICPWQDCYRTTALLGGQSTFVLAKGGHAAVIAKGPGSARASYRTSESTSTDPSDWQAESIESSGTWWEHWEQWIAERTPGTRPAPNTLGSRTHPPVDDAPGQYVRTTLT